MIYKNAYPNNRMKMIPSRLPKSQSNCRKLGGESACPHTKYATLGDIDYLGWIASSRSYAAQCLVHDPTNRSHDSFLLAEIAWNC
ncbi:hypothetical protein NPIL_412411 [Nephila pilipes]|uniref:Uncharacterized protein n=1 Tax=Nephila pilipes TaxID=299642 RepID=A0A8X6N6V5_NEPPI|nr:hypothetical protein NPIL_412411 [Nephila pilipes]